MSGTSLCCRGSRRLVYANMVVFSEEDCILIKNLYELKAVAQNDWLRSFLLKAGNYERWTNCWENWKTPERLTGDQELGDPAVRILLATYADNVALSTFTRHTPCCFVPCSNRLIYPACWATSAKYSAVVLAGREMEGHMPYRCIDPSPHTVRAVPIRFSISVHYTW